MGTADMEENFATGSVCFKDSEIHHKLPLAWF